MADYAPVQETLAPAAGPPIDPDVLEQRRKLAQALIAQAMGGEPIGSWTQGVAKLAQALMGGYNVRKTNQQEAAGRASGAADTAAALAEIAAMGGGGYGGGETADEPGTEPVSSAPTSDVEAYIRQSASKRGIDPNVAVRVARSEGLAPGVWQSNFRRNGQRETSYGPYQLLVGGGLGDKFIRQTGLNPRDPSTVKAQVDFALDQARQGGWSPWYGAAKVGVGNWTGIGRGGGGETAALPNVAPVGSAPSPDVAQFLDQPPSQQPPSLADRQALLRQVLTGAQESPADVAAEVRRYYANQPPANDMRANPRVVYPPPQPAPQPVPNVGQGAATGSGTRPSIPGGPAAMMTPAPIGRGAVAGPVPGTPMPTRPTVTGYPAIAAAMQPPPSNYDPVTMPRPLSPPDAMGRTTPDATGPVAMPQPVPQGGHVLMAHPPPAPIGKGMSIGDYGGQILGAAAPPTAQAPVSAQQVSPIDARIAQAAMAGTPTATDLGAPRGTDVPELPRARPVATLPAMPPGQQAVPVPPEHPLARQPQPRPTTPAPAAAAPATTASIPQAQPRRQIFREPGAPLSAQEFARQGQNYLTGRGSFANQTARVAPRTMQEPIAGAPAGGPVSAAPAQPRRGLLDALFGRGGPQAPAAAQAAPAGSPVAAGGAAAPADSPLARLMANPYVSDTIKAAVFARAYPKQRDPMNVPAGGTVFDPNTNKPLFTAPEKPGDEFRPMTPEEKAAYGISPDDPKPYKMNTRTNEPASVGGAPLVTVGGPETGAAKLRSKLGEKEGERLSALKEAGTTAANMRQDMEALNGLIKMAPQGPIIGPMAEAFPGFSNAGAAFQAIIKRVAPTLRVPGSGSTSDIEYQGMLDSMPSLKNRPEANAAIAGMMQAKAAINMQRSEVISQFENGAISDAEMRSQLSSIDKQSIMTPELQQLLAGLETPAAENPAPSIAPPKIGEVRKGYRFKGGDPAKPDSWEPVT